MENNIRKCWGGRTMNSNVLLVILCVLLHLLCQAAYWIMPGLTTLHILILYIPGTLVPVLVIRFALHTESEGGKNGSN